MLSAAIGVGLAGIFAVVTLPGADPVADAVCGSETVTCIDIGAGDATAVDGIEIDESDDGSLVVTVDADDFTIAAGE